MNWIKPISVAVLCFTLSVCAIVLTWNARIGIHSINSTLEDFKEYVHTEKATLEDPRNAKAIEAATQVGAVFNASGRLLNTQTLPRANKVLDALTGATLDLAAFTRHTDSAVNEKVLPAATTMIDSGRDALIALVKLQDKFGVDADTAMEALKQASEKTGKGIDALTQQIANPSWSEAADNIAKTTGQSLLVVQDLHDTTKQMPHIMAQVDKTATNISKFSKASIIAGIISNLANGFIPGLVK